MGRHLPSAHQRPPAGRSTSSGQSPSCSSPFYYFGAILPLPSPFPDILVFEKRLVLLARLHFEPFPHASLWAPHGGGCSHRPIPSLLSSLLFILFRGGPADCAVSQEENRGGKSHCHARPRRRWPHPRLLSHPLAWHVPSRAENKGTDWSPPPAGHIHQPTRGRVFAVTCRRKRRPPGTRRTTPLKEPEERKGDEECDEKKEEEGEREVGEGVTKG